MNVFDQATRMLAPCKRRGRSDIIRLVVVIFVVATILTLEAHYRHRSFKLGDLLEREEPVSLVVVSDETFSEKYKTHAKSIECYAKHHGYTFVRLNPELHAPACKKNLKSFFFQKHCTVSHWLQTQPRDLVAVVLDGDVIGGSSNKSLASWLKYKFDIAFYERCWSYEITSGNYIVRNTPFGRQFLQHWANYDYKQPKGFSSADNGAIHLAVLDALAMRGREHCYDMYRALDENSTPHNLTSYFQFVGCTRRLLGPPRTHVVTAFVGHKKSARKEYDHLDGKEGEIEQKRVGAITVFPRFFGFTVDPAIHGFTGFRNLHPFHHGVKSDTWWKDYVGQVADNFTSCREFSQNRTISDKEMGQRLRTADEYAMNVRSVEFESIPRWEQADVACYDKLWCEPLPSEAKRWPRGKVFRDEKPVEIIYECPGTDWYNEFANGVLQEMAS